MACASHDEALKTGARASVKDAPEGALKAVIGRVLKGLLTVKDAPEGALKAVIGRVLKGLLAWNISPEYPTRMPTKNVV
jgi:hypothetical protein